MTRQRATG